MDAQGKDAIPLVGIRVKEETPTRITLEWWEQTSESSHGIFAHVISLFKGILSPARADSTPKDRVSDVAAPTEIISLDFASRRATRVRKLRAGKSEQADLDLDNVSRVRIQMEELGHHFRLYLDAPGSQPFQVSIAFATGSYLSDDLIAHAKKIGKILNKPVIQQHTDLGNLISEETLRT